MRYWVVCLSLLMATPAAAQTLNCADPQTQVEMTGCAAEAYEAADEDLNLAWGMAIAQARILDQGLGADEVKTSVILRDAQRAWIPFRDKACEAESLLARGGSMQNMLFYICLERLTRARTEELRFFGEVN
ncbi:lysozyme inhibitor LprI family protein [Pseudaestuariivita sp.]|uniref:lysozyme inhibitor LprI family protein n=1 Tax=Pseudaestuariivita sp. TaxID=2211669 RepID=UPI004058125F